MLVNVWFLAKASLDYQHLFPVALIPMAMDLGLIMAWWIGPKIAARRDRGVQALKWEMDRWEGRLRDREWQLDRGKVQFESQCQAKLHQADKTIKTWEREARARIAAREAAVERQRQMLEEEIADQRQKANERQENLEKREEKLDDREKECEFRLARLNQRQELFRMKVWEPMLKRLGIRYRPPYQMRHTFATLAISMGENINWVARMLGHKSPVITLERYNRFVPNLTRLDGAALLGSVQKSETVR